ncbi:hypothetical protein HQQ81_06905 [Microbacteriaceae bacterium VKM Ac-2854]|nr:hypothetical protein [Microbacteriaceae bacterium VKM Ac-2854]
MTASEHTRPEPDERITPSDPSRRLLVGAAAAVGAAGAVALVGTPAGAWAAPAVTQIFGLPGAAASGASGLLARVRFDGSQTVTNGAGAAVTLPARIVFANVGTEVAIPAGATIGLSLSYEGTALTVDRSASAAAASINGVVSAGAVIVAGSNFIVQLGLDAGAVVTIPIVATATDRVPALAEGTARTSYAVSASDSSPAADRSDSVSTSITGGSTAPAYEATFHGSRRTAPGASGATWDYPEFLSVKRLVDDSVDDGATELQLHVVRDRFPFGLSAIEATLDGVPTTRSRSVPGGRDSDPYYSVGLPLAKGSVVEFRLAALSGPGDDPTANGEYRLIESYDPDNPGVTATTTVTRGPQYTELFDAAIALTGSMPYTVPFYGIEWVPTALTLTATTGVAIPAGSVITTHSFYNASYGAASIGGVAVPDAFDVTDVNDYRYDLSEAIILRVEVPANSSLTIPLEWAEYEGGPMYDLTVELKTDGRDSDRRNNTAVAKISTF